MSSFDTETPFDCGSIKTTFDDDDNFIHKFRNGKIAFKFPNIDLDRFCHSGTVIEEAAEVSQRTITSGAEMLPEKSRAFVAEHGPMLRTKIKDGWTSTLAMIPLSVSEFWNSTTQKHHDKKDDESDENSSSGLAMR